MKEIVIKNAVIRSARIHIEDHDILTVWLDLDYGGMCQGFGGYGFYAKPKDWWKKDFPYCARFIWRCLEIADVDAWDKLPGKTIRARSDSGKVHAIGHIVKDDWFDPSEN